MPFVEKVKRGVRHVKDSLHLPSRISTPELPTDSITNSLSPPLSANPSFVSIVAPADSTLVLGPSGEAPYTNSSSTNPDILPAQTPDAVSDVPVNREQTPGSTTWTGLRSFIGLLNKNASVFGPLKSVVDEILGCIEVYERVGQGREEYVKLGQELDSLFKELTQHFAESTSPKITSTIYNLAKGIQKELRVVESKGQRNMLERVTEASGDMDEVLECYRRVQRLLQRLAVNANVSVWRIVDDQANEQRLKSLLPSLSAKYSSIEAEAMGRGGCTPNTRVDVLKRLGNWAYDSDGEKIYWLNGMAGTGKTTVAYTLCEQLQAASKLAATFFCSRQLPECRNASLIFPTIAYQLARFSLPFQFALLQAIERDPDVCGQRLIDQFKILIFEPLMTTKDGLPEDLVVAIDALDECENPDSVGQILDILFSHTPDLPIKFLITSRPEPQIRRRMLSRRGEQRTRFELHLHDLDRSIVKEDILTYLCGELKEMKLASTDLERFAERSGSLFIYAATVVRYLSFEDFTRGPDRLQKVLGTTLVSSESMKPRKEGTPGSSEDEKDVSGRSEKEVDLLYATILKAAMEDTRLENREKVERRRVLHTIVCAQEPLTVASIAGLMGLSSSNSVHRALQPLLSVIHVSEEIGLVTTLHESFPNYLCNQHRAGEFHCDVAKHNGWLANRCFVVMKIPDPPFNICNLQSSYVFDEKVEGLKERVERSIPRELLYAYRYWGAHLVAGDNSKRLADALFEFLKTRLLLWMEVLNLTNSSSISASMLPKVQAWCQRDRCPDDVRELVQDGWRFITTYSSSPASRSTPHLYVSTLAFWPRERAISRWYLGRMERLAEPGGTAMEVQTPTVLAVCKHKGNPIAVAYSPGGDHIAAGSDSGTICIWDAFTGQIVSELFEGDTGLVRSVSYSPDGARIISCYGHTIRIWDTHTCRTIGKPLQGHSGPVTSAMYSPDGARIVSGSLDNTVRIWDAHTGQMVGKPLRGHSNVVWSVAYSPDSRLIVSGCDDGTALIWDASTGQTIGQPLSGHTGPVVSVAYSPYGTRIISGAMDHTLRIWDVRTGCTIGQPLSGHTNSVNSAAYSPDGTRIVSGSSDHTVRVWDSNTGQMIGQSLEGHDDTINSVGYSPDGSRIISVSYDKTLRIWDAHNIQALNSTPQVHTGSASCTQYSPDGNHIVSSSGRTVRIWDAHNYRMIGKPLQDHTTPIDRPFQSRVSRAESVKYSPDGSRIMSVFDDCLARIWDANTGQSILDSLQAQARNIISIAYSPDGIHIVSNFYSNLQIWNGQMDQKIGEPLVGHTGSVSSVSYSPDGNCIVSGSDDKTLRIWDAHKGVIKGEPLVGHTGSVTSVMYSPNSACIVSGSSDNTLRIWDAHTGQMIGEPLIGHTREVISVAFSPDGTRIVSGSNDKTLRIWDATNGHMLGQPLSGHKGSIMSVAYSPDGTRIVSGSYDNTVRVWDAYPESRHNSTKPSSPWSMDDDGWLADEQSNPLIWVPVNLQAVLLRDPCIYIISNQGILTLDLSRVPLGDSWYKCYRHIDSFGST